MMQCAAAKTLLCMMPTLGIVGKGVATCPGLESDGWRFGAPGVIVRGGKNFEHKKTSRGRIMTIAIDTHTNSYVINVT